MRYNNKFFKTILGFLIVGYVGFGLLGRFFGTSVDEFYHLLIDNEENFTAIVYSSASFHRPGKILNKDAVGQFVLCLKSLERTVANLGTNKDDKFYYMAFESDNYQYRFGIKWRPTTRMGYITGVEKKVDLRTGEEISPSAFNKLGGRCLDHFINENLG